jgi:hypothetical protein
MLADLEQRPTDLGMLAREVHTPATFLRELLGFITDQLPRWRDRPDRKPESSETVLTSRLCAHLNSAARNSGGWDILQFRPEEPDEQTPGRKIDLVAAPLAATIWVDGRRHDDFDTLLPIECKRLPTPKGTDRDEREYVFNQFGSTGGIQRFKAGHHGAKHNLAAMIAYVQEETCPYWDARIAEWIKGLVEAKVEGWASDDTLHLDMNDTTRQLAVLSSRHTRAHELPQIELRHLWLQMQKR